MTDKSKLIDLINGFADNIYFAEYKKEITVLKKTINFSDISKNTSNWEGWKDQTVKFIEFYKRGSKIKKIDSPEIKTDEEEINSNKELELREEQKGRFSDYKKTRILWALHNKNFIDWERQFILSLGNRLRENLPLSIKQKEILYKIFDKYGIDPKRNLQIMLVVSKKLKDR